MNRFFLLDSNHKDVTGKFRFGPTFVPGVANPNVLSDAETSELAILSVVNEIVRLNCFHYVDFVIKTTVFPDGVHRALATAVVATLIKE